MSNLEQTIDVGLIEQIHETVVAALEEDLYRTHIGRFRLQSASGEFHVGNYRDGKRVLVQPGTIERYELHLQLRVENISGAGNSVDDVGLIYHQEVIGQRIHRNVEVSFHYPQERGKETGAGALDLFGFELISRSMTYNHPERGRFVPEIFRWIYNQLRTEAKAKARASR